MADVPPPGEVTVLNAGQETVSLGLQLTNYSVGYRLQIDYSCDTQRGSLISQDSSTVKVEGLHPGTEYTFSIIRIADNGNQSKATSLCVFTGKSEKQINKTLKHTCRKMLVYCLWAHNLYKCTSTLRYEKVYVICVFVFYHTFCGLL